MNKVVIQSQERDVYRWGGIAGILGSVVLVVVFGIVGVFVGSAGLTPATALSAFPDIFVARVFENGLFLVVLILWSVHFTGLFYALRQARLAAALFGSVLGVLGLTVMAVGALPHVATMPVSEFYTQPGISAAEQETLTMVWTTVSAIFDAILIAGLVIAPFGFLGIGVAMLRAQGFGRWFAWGSFALGMAGAVAAVVSLTTPHSPIAALSVIGMIVFHFAVGWRLVRFSTRMSSSGG